MKNLIALALTLMVALTSCVSTAPDILPTDGAIGRQVQRVVERHDNYVLADDTLSPEASDDALDESAALAALVGLPSVSRDALRSVLVPVAVRHDAYVSKDAALDSLERETYLGSTGGLMRLVHAK